ncbi:MAG: T9SS type A sorting domain-containing protein [Flavobacterium sp.]|jgi:hypothetical protein|nr:T9SS type A sorting domain-containing protein [Flavobacterium sp.]
MKKITLLGLLLFGSVTAFSQTYSTGTITLTNTTNLGMTLRLDVGSEVNMTLTGPSDRWFSVGFGATSMTAGTDVVLVHTNGTLTSFDRVLPGFGAPTADANQNWTINSNTVTGNVRTITASRALITGDSNDFVFPAIPSSLNIIWARASSNNYNLVYHGGNNRGVTAVNFTLGSNDFASANVKMFPNPANANVFLELPQNLVKAEVIIYDMLGKKVKQITYNQNAISIPVNDLSKGMYQVNIVSDELVLNQNLIIN